MSLPVDLSRVRWRKAGRSSSTGSDCVEVAGLRDVIAIRDSKNADGPKLILTPTAWQDLVSRTGNGELNL